MTNEELKKIWSEKFAVVPQVLENMKQVQAAATAFNTNVDAVVKISGAKIAELAAGLGMDLAELEDVRQTKLDSGKDVVKGIFKCFTKGIAEEWLTEDKQVYDWMVNNLGYDRLQMGGQGGIVRDDHDGHAVFPALLLQKRKDLLAGLVVKRTGRLVAQ